MKTNAIYVILILSLVLALTSVMLHAQQYPALGDCGKISQTHPIRSISEKGYFAAYVNGVLKADSPDYPDMESSYSFNDKGYPIRYLNDSESNAQPMEAFVYNDKNQLIEKKIYNDLTQKPSIIVVYIYDDNGRLIQSRNTGGSIGEEEVCTYLYNAKGMLSGINNNGYFTYYTYNENGDIIREVSQLDGIPDIITDFKYKYDSKKRIVEKTSVRSDGTGETEKYEYDEYDNWIRKISGITLSTGNWAIYTREITY